MPIVSGSARSTGSRARRSGLLGTLLVGSVLMFPALGATAASAVEPGGDQVAPGIIVEGPGYAGTADELLVTWVAQPVSHAAPAGAVRPMWGAPAAVGGLGGRPGAASPDPNLIQTQDSQLGLSILGVGFRGRSKVTVRVGEADPVVARTDATGTLALQVVGVPAAATRPGMSVVAVGRSPAGTTRTLLGAVPPLPNGPGPADFIPWLAAGAGLLVLARRVRATRVGRGDQGTTVQPRRAAAAPE